MSEMEARVSRPRRAGRRALAGVAVLAIAATGAAWSGCGDDEDDVNQAIDDAQQQAEDAAEEAGGQAEELQQQADEQIEEAQQQAEEQIDEAQQQLEDAQEAAP